MAYSGPGKYTSWMSLGYGGLANPTATSEKIPVLVDSTTTYSAQIDAAPVAGWASGYSLTLTFFNSSNVSLATQNVTSGPLVAGVHTQNSTTPTVAPVGSSYCTAQIQYTGSPAAANLLNIYMLKVATGSNSNIPDVVNFNYAFSNGTWPWASSNQAILNSNAAVLTGTDGNYDSLVIAGIIELMGGPEGVQCQIPNLTDPVSGLSAAFRISTPGGQLQTLSQSGSGPYDLGDFQPTQDFVETALLDGERPFGTRSSNRTMSIPVAIYAPTQQVLDAARDYLLSVINQQTFEIAWTPKSSGLTTIYDCFRALPSTIMYGFNNLREGAPGAPAIGMVTINIPASPFGKSGIDGVVEVDFSSGLVSGSPAASAVVIDDFSSTIDTSDNWVLNTQYPVIGTHCVSHRNATPIKSPYGPAVYQRTGLSVNIVGCPVLSVWVGQSYDNQWPKDPRFKSNVTISAVLTDVNGKTVSCKQTVNNLKWNASASKPTWTQVSLPIPQKNPNFSYASVTGYKLTVTNWTGGGTAGFVRMNAWLGYVSANPMSITQASSPRGIVYNMFGLVGSARSPVSAQVQLPNTDPIVQEFTQSGFFQVPGGVTTLQAECWGAGGAGSSVSTPLPGGGGGGGEYAVEPSLSVTPGQKVPFTIGTGGQAAQLTPTVLTFKTHGVGTTWTCPANVTSATIECWAGGAAGAPGGGGGGAGGYTENTVTGLTSGTAYAMWVGNGGQPNTGTSSQANAARNGQNTWFGNPGTKSISGALIGALGGTSPLAGSASGGAGGKGQPSTYLVLAYQGGAGGRSPGGAGGGGGASSDSTGAGAPGAASPKLGAGAAGDYLTGGAGGSGPGGAGGTGANVPGAATPGTGPGGGGGGGYTRTVATSSGNQAVNYQGAAGAPGMIRITFYVNSGNPVNGTGTTFGSTATTSAVVTANGGVSAVANSGSGGTGGSGSTNSAHFPGGTAGLANRNSNYLLTPGTNQASLGSGTASAATSLAITSGTTLTQAQIQAGVILMVSVVTSTALVNPVALDTAGNQYYLANSTPLTDTSCLSTFVAQLQFAVSSGNQITVSNAATVNWAGVWGAVIGVRDLEDTAITAATGNSSTGSVARTYPDIGATYYEVVVVGNNGSSTTQSSLSSSISPSAFTSVVNGTLGLNFVCRLAQGSANAVTLSGSLGGSMPWALVTLPFIATNQNGQLIPTASNNPFSATSGTITNSGPAAISIDANAAYHIVKLHTAAAATYTVTDSASNGGGGGYTQLGVATAGSQRIYLFGARVTASLTGAWTVTATSATNQAFSMCSFVVPGGSAADATGTAVSNATGTAVSLAYPSTTNPSTLQLGVVGYPNNGDLVTGSPAWSGGASGAKLRADANSVMPAEDDFYALQQNGLNTPTFTTTLSSSQTWGAIVVSIVTPDYSGGGGASGGVAGAGLDATLGTSGGAPSYTFGGKGANGQIGNASGTVGAVPGGGGSGATRISGMTSYAGGNGANGMVRVTHQPPLIPFNDFILHRPGENAPMDLNPLVPIPVSDPPDNREYAVPHTTVGRNAVFKGTYTVMLCNASWDSPGNSRRISVTVNQYEYAGGPAVSVQATRTLTPATDVVNGYVSMGELTLPIKSVSQSNSDCYYTVSIHDTNQNDAFQDLLFLDVQGQTVLVNIAPGSAGDSRYGNYYIDEPDLDHDLGLLLGSSHERDRAISVLDMAMVTGGPLYVAPGDNLLLTYSTKGALNLVITYLPRWFSDRVL